MKRLFANALLSMVLDRAARNRLDRLTGHLPETPERPERSELPEMAEEEHIKMRHEAAKVRKLLRRDVIAKLDQLQHRLDENAVQSASVTPTTPPSRDQERRPTAGPPERSIILSQQTSLDRKAKDKPKAKAKAAKAKTKTLPPATPVAPAPVSPAKPEARKAQPTPPPETRPTTGPTTRPSVTEALSIRAQQSHVLDHLDPETRQKLRHLAEAVLGDPESSS